MLIANRPSPVLQINLLGFKPARHQPFDAYAAARSCRRLAVAAASTCPSAVSTTP